MTGLSVGPPITDDNADSGYSSDEDDILSAPKVSYKKRKEETAKKEEPWLEVDGIEYGTTEPLISE
jgi:hypothetical protein|tara:strand:- start:99 stop:296 length:198 start_codon:yes stop_codon:yes gene_type:complete